MPQCSQCFGQMSKCGDCGNIGCNARTGPGNRETCLNAAFVNYVTGGDVCSRCGGREKQPL